MPAVWDTLQLRGPFTKCHLDFWTNLFHLFGFLSMMNFLITWSDCSQILCDTLHDFFCPCNACQGHFLRCSQLLLVIILTHAVARMSPVNVTSHHFSRILYFYLFVHTHTTDNHRCWMNVEIWYQRPCNIYNTIADNMQMSVYIDIFQLKLKMLRSVILP